MCDVSQSRYKSNGKRRNGPIDKGHSLCAIINNSATRRPRWRHKHKVQDDRQSRRHKRRRRKGMDSCTLNHSNCKVRRWCKMRAMEQWAHHCLRLLSPPDAA